MLTCVGPWRMYDLTMSAPSNMDCMQRFNTYVQLLAEILERHSY